MGTERTYRGSLQAGIAPQRELIEDLPVEFGSGAVGVGAPRASPVDPSGFDQWKCTRPLLPLPM